MVYNFLSGHGLFIPCGLWLMEHESGKKFDIIVFLGTILSPITTILCPFLFIWFFIKVAMEPDNRTPDQIKADEEKN